jgi:hypothetical protein
MSNINQNEIEKMTSDIQKVMEIPVGRFEEVSPEQKKRFAKEQLEFLKSKGIKNKLRLSRIFKAAGPGQIQNAWTLANCEDWTNEENDGPASKDLLDCILTGVGGMQDFGWKRMEDVLELAGFFIPKCSSSHSFFRTLGGALEILVPGSYKFTKDEMDEILNGLSKFDADENDEKPKQEQ